MQVFRRLATQSMSMHEIQDMIVPAQVLLASPFGQGLSLLYAAGSF